MDRVKLATVWLGGCSGCHMSFLDLDEWLLDLADQVDLVFSPFADVKQFPSDVDVTLVEGAVTNTDNLELIGRVRERTRVLVSFGDCAVTGNVTSMRNPLGGPLEVLRPCYLERGDLNATLPDGDGIVPGLLKKVLPVHQVVPVEVYLTGCPPPPDRIRRVLEAVLDGRSVELTPADRWFG